MARRRALISRHFSVWQLKARDMMKADAHRRWGGGEVVMVTMVTSLCRRTLVARCLVRWLRSGQAAVHRKQLCKAEDHARRIIIETAFQT